MKTDREKSTESTLTPEIQSRLRLYRRVLISYETSSKRVTVLLAYSKEIFYLHFPQENHILLQARNCAMVISYSRPFSGHDTGATPKISGLPRRFIRTFSQEDKEIHEIVLRNRNTGFAHSNSQAWEIETKIFRQEGQCLLTPMYDNVHAPFNQETVVLFSKMCEKLMPALCFERDDLEADLLNRQLNRLSVNSLNA